MKIFVNRGILGDQEIGAIGSDSRAEIKLEEVQNFFRNIADDILNKLGIDGFYKKEGLKALVCPFNRVMFCPEPFDLERLLIFSIAVAHVELESPDWRPFHRMAFQAVKNAKHRLRSYNVFISEASNRIARQHIATAIHQDVNEGVRVIHEEAFWLSSEEYLIHFQPEGLPEGVELENVPKTLSEWPGEIVLIEPLVSLSSRS